MNNRFNVKDIVVITLLLVLGVMIYLSMVQKQRQWSVLQDTLTEIENQRESVDAYKRQLTEYERGQASLRKGVEQMSANVGEMTESVREMVDVLKQSAAEGGGGAQISGDLGGGLDEGGPVDFGADKSEDETFYRVAGLRDRPDFAEGDFYIDAFGATVAKLTPLVSGDIYADRIQGYVLDTLLRMDPETLEYEPWVAESWEISDDGLTFTFKLREDVVFPDGEPLTAEDVQFTYEWIMNPKVAAPRARAYYEKFEHVRALDDYTVEFKFREPYFAALGLCGEMDILAEHYYGDFTEDEFNETPGLLFGSGPYRMSADPTTWQPGSQKIELVRNDSHWGPRPPLDRVIWREILEDTAMEAEFRNREIDRLSVRPSSYRKLSRDQDLREQANLYEYEYVSSGYIYIGWNQRKNDKPTPFADKRVRQAMTMLIDREGICSRVYDNLATPATGPFHPMGWQADKSIDPWPYDPERAKALLAEAGYVDRDGDGWRESPDGVPLSYELIFSTGSAEGKQMVLLMQDAMAKAGVELKLDPLDWPIMQQKLDDRSFDAIMLGWGGVVDSDVYQMFHSEQTEDGGDNYTYYISDKVDKLIEQARITVDREKGAELWRQVHAELHEDQPYTFMFNRKAVVYMDKRFKNVQITKMGMNFAWEYYVPQADQLHTAP